METKNYERLGIKIHETGNFNTNSSIKRNDKIIAIKGLKNFLDFDEFKNAYKILVHERPDILMVYDYPSIAILAYKIRFIFKKKTRLILKLDSDGSEFANMKGLKRYISVLYKFYTRMLFDRVIVESSCGYNKFQNIFGKKLGIVPNSVSYEYMKNYVENKREKTIITVSRIDKVKNIILLINAFTKIADNFPDWNLKIIGPITDKKYYGSLNKLIIKYGLQNRITFTGTVDLPQLIDIYRKSSIFCLFSFNEGFPISRMEAIAMGMYVISTEAGCASDLLKYGIHIVPYDIKKSSEEIKKAIISIEKNEYNFSQKKISSYKDLAEKIIKNDF
ncbi:MAG: glycosyltransferase family 4 protein [Thermoplasmata archaeon]